MINADYHVHCSYSDDSQTPMENMVVAAVEKGINELCFTDHVDYGVKIDWDDSGTTARLINGLPARNVDYPRYFEEIEALNKKYAGKITIKRGLEFGMQRHTVHQFE
ncbi:MAG: PHP domain-containing protein, partial [Erysipelotrichaceae bacterium]|nr:PHP domain-containing protein [Erysipelotrichaceae bacterium]